VELTKPTFQAGPASLLAVGVTEGEGGYLLNWQKQELPDGLGENVLFQRWKGDGTWGEPGRNVEWIPKGTAIIYRTLGLNTPDMALTELFAPGIFHAHIEAFAESSRVKKRTRRFSPEVEIVSGMAQGFMLK
jgi:hypothetical protein